MSENRCKADLVKVLLVATLKLTIIVGRKPSYYCSKLLKKNSTVQQPYLSNNKQKKQEKKKHFEDV